MLAEGRIDGMGARACTQRALFMAGAGKRTGCDTNANGCACSEKYGSARWIARFWGLTRQQELSAFIVAVAQVCAMLWQQACCPIGCIACKQADDGIAIHRIVIASINHARCLPLPTCTVYLLSTYISMGFDMRASQ